MAATYSIQANNISMTAANQSLLHIFSAVGSTGTVKIYKIMVANSNIYQPAGALGVLALSKMTAVTASQTTFTPRTFDSTNPSWGSGITASITAGSKATVTLSDTIRRMTWIVRAPLVQGTGTIFAHPSMETFTQWMSLWDSGFNESNNKPITLKANTGEGLSVQNVSFTAGFANIYMEFTVE